jgi:hypothetical protein
VELQIDLNSNNWTFLLDNVSKGSFQNSYRQIASMDIYSMAYSSFYIDDVSYTYTPYTKPNLNAAVTYISIPGKLAGQSVIPSVEIRNLGTQTINSATIEFDYNSVKQTKNISGLNLSYLGTTVINLDNNITLLPSTSTVTATLKTVNGVSDDIVSDNTKSRILNSPVPAAGKAVVVEEATGTWCQWCPRGAVWLKNMDATYGNLFIGIAVHNNDPMLFYPYDKGMASKVSSYPSVLVDRSSAMDPSAMEPDFLERIMVTPKAIIRNGAKYNSTTRSLDVSLTTKFNQAVTGNYKIAFVLVEDSVTGTATKFAQSNAYAGGGSGVMGGFESLPNPVPANKMVYDHVGRVVSPNFFGLPNSFSGTINLGDSFTHNFTVVLDPTWKTNKLHIVGLLIDPSGRIDNGSMVDMGQAIQNGFVAGTAVTGIKELSVNINTVNVFPNPSNKQFNLILPAGCINSKEINIYDMKGQLLETIQLNGKENIVIDAEGYSAGIYSGTINNNGQTFKFRLIKD